jgi:acetone carboxylase gamma subunit
VRTHIDERFRLEVAQYGLRFSCPDCAYFAPEVQACSEGYPVHEHLRTDLNREDLLFCKLFEAG